MPLDHIARHNDQRTRALAQAARFAVSGTLNGPFTGGEPNGIADHNALVDLLRRIAGVAGITVTLPDEAHLGDPGHTTDHDLIDTALTAIEAATAWNEASGGQGVDTVPDYMGTGQTWRVHTFVGTSTLTVTRAVRPFRMLAIGGGGGGSNRAGGGGGGVWEGDINLTAQAYQAVVGAGGPANGAGGSSGIANVAAAGGGQQGVPHPTGTGGQAGTGSPWPGYAGGGTPNPDMYGGGGGGAGGAGGAGSSAGGGTGGAGGSGGWTDMHPSGQRTYYGGGGGGSTGVNNPALAGTGGAGGGGIGGHASAAGTDGAANTGGGGGAGYSAPPRAGGSGLVLIAYQIA